MGEAVEAEGGEGAEGWEEEEEIAEFKVVIRQVKEDDWAEGEGEAEGSAAMKLYEIEHADKDERNGQVEVGGEFGEEAEGDRQNVGGGELGEFAGGEGERGAEGDCPIVEVGERDDKERGGE